MKYLKMWGAGKPYTLPAYPLAKHAVRLPSYSESDGAARAVRELERGGRLRQADQLVLHLRARRLTELLLRLRGGACGPHPGHPDLDCRHAHHRPDDRGQQERPDRTEHDDRPGAAASAQLAARGRRHPAGRGETLGDRQPPVLTCGAMECRRRAVQGHAPGSLPRDRTTVRACAVRVP